MEVEIQLGGVDGVRLPEVELYGMQTFAEKYRLNEAKVVEITDELQGLMVAKLMRELVTAEVVKGGDFSDIVGGAK
jgi:hypothetical protein